MNKSLSALISILCLAILPQSAVHAGLDDEFNQQQRQQQESARQRKQQHARNEALRKQFCALVKSKGQYTNPRPLNEGRDYFYIDSAGRVFSTEDHDCRRLLGYTNRETSDKRYMGWMTQYKAEPKFLFLYIKGLGQRIMKKQIAVRR